MTLHIGTKLIHAHPRTGKSLNEDAMQQKPPYMTDAEWDEAVMFGQSSQHDGEDVVMFRRIDLASYLSMLGVESEGHPENP